MKNVPVSTLALIGACSYTSSRYDPISSGYRSEEELAKFRWKISCKVC